MNLYDEFVSITGALDAAGVPFTIRGALAVAIHGFVRATTDIDLLILAEDVQRAKDAVKPVGFSLPAAPMTFGHGTPSERRVHRVSKIVGDDHLVLDLLEVKHLDDEVWADRQMLDWQGRRVSVVSREGLVRMKRLAGREKDLLDLQGLGMMARDE